MSYVILWEFQVHKRCQREFEDAYGASGAWAVLFRKSGDYRGTELLCDASAPGRYLTVDRWTSAEAFDKFRRTHAAEYQALDAHCEALTESDGALGTWTTLDS